MSIFNINVFVIMCEIIIIILLTISCGILMNWSIAINESFLIKEILSFSGMIIVIKILNKYL
jgi:hypothetical protein